MVGYIDPGEPADLSQPRFPSAYPPCPGSPDFHSSSGGSLLRSISPIFDREEEDRTNFATGPERLSSLNLLVVEDEQEEKDEREAWLKARREEKLLKRRSSGRVQKRTISQSIGSDTDDEDLEPFDAANDEGSSARRLRRASVQRTKLKFDDPPRAISEVEEHAISVGDGATIADHELRQYNGINNSMEAIDKVSKSIMEAVRTAWNAAKIDTKETEQLTDPNLSPSSLTQTGGDSHAADPRDIELGGNSGRTVSYKTSHTLEPRKGARYDASIFPLRSTRRTHEPSPDPRTRRRLDPSENEPYLRDAPMVPLIDKNEKTDAVGDVGHQALKSGIQALDEDDNTGRSPGASNSNPEQLQDSRQSQMPAAQRRNQTQGHRHGDQIIEGYDQAGYGYTNPKELVQYDLNSGGAHSNYNIPINGGSRRSKRYSMTSKRPVDTERVVVEDIGSIGKPDMTPVLDDDDSKASRAAQQGWSNRTGPTDSIESEEAVISRGAILRSQQAEFLEDSLSIRERIASLKDANKDDIPPDARWTKIDRKLVSPEALEAGIERYEAREDFVIVLRLLNKDQVQYYADITQKIREARKAGEDNLAIDRGSDHHIAKDESSLNNLPRLQGIREADEATTSHVDDSDKVDEALPRDIESESGIDDGRTRKSYDDCNDTSTISRSSSIASIADSVFSMISGSSMSSITGSQGASERFVALLLGDDIIKPLCDEALATVPAERFERNLRRLLKDFAVELRKEAETVQQRHAAHFVRYRARNSAHMICNSFNQKRPARKPVLVELEYISEDSDCGSSDDEMNDLQQLEAFIKASKAIQLLREKLRDFIYPADANDKTNTPKEQRQDQKNAESKWVFVELLEYPLAPEKSFPMNIHSTDTVAALKLQIHNSRRIPLACQILTFNGKQLEDGHTIEGYNIQNDNIIYLSKGVTYAGDAEDKIDENPAITPLEAPYKRTRQTLIFLVRFTLLKMGLQPRPVAAGKTRLRWQCKCGHKSYDDFVELRPGGIERLRQAMNRTAGSDLSSKSSTFSSASRTFSSGLSSLRGILTWGSTKSIEDGLPLHGRQPSGNQLDVAPTQPAVPEKQVQELVYLLLCYSQGRYATRLLQLDLIQLQAKSDKVLFKILRDNYDGMKGRSTYFSLRTLVSIKFVQFEMYRSELVDVRKEDAIPPPGNIEYQYKPAPPELIPPLGDRHMMHLFHHPSHADDDTVCLERFPKKLKEKLKCNSGVNPGWGLQFVEGWNIKKIWVLAFVFFGLGSLLIGVLWAAYERSIQDAFAIASYMVAFATVSVGTVQAFLVM